MYPHQSVQAVQFCDPPLASCCWLIMAAGNASCPSACSYACCHACRLAAAMLFSPPQASRLAIAVDWCAHARLRPLGSPLFWLHASWARWVPLTPRLLGHSSSGLNGSSSSLNGSRLNSSGVCRDLLLLLQAAAGCAAQCAAQAQEEQ
jgi:hypothetical protein